MANLKDIASVRLIGDVVQSRHAGDRADLHARLQAALVRVNDHHDGDLRITVGDEFQGTLAHLGAAVRATVDMRVDLLPDYDVRFGLGRGGAQVLSPSPRVEDGPGWWAAREAIDRSKELAETALSDTRTQYVDPADPALCEAVNASLLAMDLLISRLDPAGLSVLRGMLRADNQHHIAESLGISASAVSQRLRRNGISVVMAMTSRLEKLH